MSIDHERLLKPARKLRKILKSLPKDPAPKQVHSLRTNTRRLEATLAAISSDRLTGQKKLLKEVARIRKKAGKVRDMDVLTSFACSLTAQGEDDCRVQLLEHLGGERERHARKLHATVAKQAATTRARLKHASAQLETMLCMDGVKNCDSDQLPAQVTASALKLESKLSDTAHLTRVNLHPYRLKVKELHNLLRMGENSDNEDFVQALNSVKDAIGEWHDWGELLAIATELLDHPNCKLLRELKARSDKKYEDALSAAESMRKKYLRRDGKRPSRKKNVVAEPAWKATTRLAA
jgi:CHAD domain-containing protein